MGKFISLCMIVKNEEKVIDRCLSTVAHLVDETIIVDTGSIDNTKEIVKKYTDKVYDFEWIGDFSAARNFAASHASGEWILVLDADEYIDEENFKAFIEDLRSNSNNFDAYTAKILNFTGSYGENLIQNFHDRIYKNNGEIEYFRKIHEQFKHISDKELLIGTSNLLIFHSGYINHTVEEKKKNIRNKELLEKEMSDGTTRAFDYFNFGNEYYSLGEYSQALEAYLLAYKKKEDFRLAWVSTTLVQIVICLMQLKRYNDALNVISEAEAIYGTSPEFPYLRGEIFYLRGQLEDAKHVFSQIVNSHHLNHIILRPDLKDQLPHRRLGDIFLYEEQYQNAIFHFVSVLNINRNCEESIRKVIFILNKFHSNQEIKEFLISKELVSKNNILSYARASMDIGNGELAELLLEVYGEDYPILRSASNLKKVSIENKEIQTETLNNLNPNVIDELRRSQWINTVDLYLAKPVIDDPTIQEYLSIDHDIHTLDQIIKSGINDENQERLYIQSLATLLLYRKLDLCDSLLKYTSKLNKEGVALVASILYQNNFKAEALHFYNEVDWDFLNQEDFINIIKSLLQTGLSDDAVQVSQYALSRFPEDFRFFKYVLENSKEEVFENTLKTAQNTFHESLYLERYSI